MKKYFIFALISTLSLASCSNNDAPDDLQKDQVEDSGSTGRDESEENPEYIETTYAEMSTAEVNAVASKFAVDFFLLADKVTPENFVYSPVNQFGAMALLANGAREWTRDEILKAMSFNGVNIDDVNKYYSEYYLRLIEITPWENNYASGFAISSKSALNDDYLAAVSETYNPMAFAKDNTDYLTGLNSWISDVTYGLVKDAVTTSSGDFDITSIANFFNAWGIGFEQSEFTNGKFTNYDATQSDVVFMNHKLSFDLTQLQNGVMVTTDMSSRTSPLKTRFLFGLLLPNNGTDLNGFISDNREAIQNPADLGEITYVEIALPKFEISSRISTKEVLAGADILLPFADKANYSDMLLESIAPGDLTQICNVSIDEKGISSTWSEGTKEKWVGGTPAHLLVGPTPVKADHPFAFFVLEKTTKTFIYFGKVAKL